MYAAIDLDSRLLLDVAVFGRRGTDPAAAFLHGLTEKYDLAEAEFLADGAGYLIALSRLGLSGQLD
jgi:transposase-like protein